MCVDANNGPNTINPFALGAYFALGAHSAACLMHLWQTNTSIQLNDAYEINLQVI